jgi:hypothetical protein
MAASAWHVRQWEGVVSSPGIIVWPTLLLDMYSNKINHEHCCTSVFSGPATWGKRDRQLGRFPSNWHRHVSRLNPQKLDWSSWSESTSEQGFVNGTRKKNTDVPLEMLPHLYEIKSGYKQLSHKNQLHIIQNAKKKTNQWFYKMIWAHIFIR